MILETKAKLALILLGIAALSVASASKNEDSNDLQYVDFDGKLMSILNSRRDSKNDDAEIDNKLLSYEPMLNNVKYPSLDSYLDELQRARNPDSEVQAVPKKEVPKLVVMDQKKVAQIPSLPVVDQRGSDPARDETIKLIAHNSREIRLIGPEEKEVEMKDDAATKMAVAIENLRKEAGEVWGQVNTKLDKGWTDFKTMVDDAVESAKKKSSKPSALDEIVAGADTAVKTIKDQTEIAGTKIKGFFNNLGINV